MKFLDATGLEKLWSLIRGVTDGLQSAVEAAQSTASTALTTANSASSTASAAQTAASEAYTMADAAAASAYAAQTAANTAQSTAEAAQSTADSAASTASTALSTANSASSTASSASSTATSARTTANTASSTASAAQTTANEALELAESAQPLIPVSKYTFSSLSTSNVSSTSTFCTRSRSATTTSWAPSSINATYTSTYGRWQIPADGAVLVWATAYVGLNTGQTLAFGIGGASSSSSYTVSTTYFEGLYQNPSTSSTSYVTVTVPPTLIYSTSTVYIGPYMRSSSTPSSIGSLDFHIMRLRNS